MNRKKVLSVLLAAITAFGTFAGCKKDGGNNGGEVTDYDTAVTYENGIHRKSVKYTSEDFVKNGVSEWKILIGTEVSSKVRNAANEFVAIFKEATGVTLAVEKSNVAYSESAKYISFGDNEFSRTSGVTRPDDLKRNGYVIKTAGKSIVAFGGGDLGTLFSAYGLLNALFDYEYYFQDTFGNECYYVKTGVTGLKFPELDVYDNPDFDHAIAGYLPMHTDADKAHKMRMETINEMYICGTGISYVHNTLQYLPKETYQQRHPKWYATNNSQLCYTARGDKKEYNALIEELSSVMISAIKENPEGEIITLTHMDDGFWCECADCKALNLKYGTDAASCIMLTNDVADKIEEWRKAEAPERKITVVMFAYTSTENPPAVKNADGEWTAIDDSVKTRDNVCVLFAPIYSMSYNHEIPTERNSDTEDQLRGWEAVSDHISVWSYSAMFYNYFMPYDTYSACRNQYVRWLNAGALWIFDNAQYDIKAPLGFSALKAYLNSVWSWDVNRNYTELVDGFFANYFGVKDGSMREFYEELRLWLKKLDEDGVSGLTGTSHANWDDASLWSKRMLDRWIAYTETAKTEVESLKETAPEKYAVIVDRITIESLMPRYMSLTFYSSNYSSEELKAARASFAADCRRLGVDKYGENTRDIETIIRDW